MTQREQELTDFLYDAHGKIESAVDWLGHRVYVGQKVLYCIGAGRGQMVAIGELLSIEVIDHPYQDWRNPSITHIQKEIRTKVLTEKTSGMYDNEKRSRPALTNPMNITALPPGFYPEG